MPVRYTNFLIFKIPEKSCNVCNTHLNTLHIDSDILLLTVINVSKDLSYSLKSDIPHFRLLSASKSTLLSRKLSLHSHYPSNLIRLYFKRWNGSSQLTRIPTKPRPLTTVLVLSAPLTYWTYATSYTKKLWNFCSAAYEYCPSSSVRGFSFQNTKRSSLSHAIWRRLYWRGASGKEGNTHTLQEIEKGMYRAFSASACSLWRAVWMTIMNLTVLPLILPT